MLIGRVIDHKVHHQLHITLLQSGDEVVNVSQCAISRINVFVIGNIVTLESLATHERSHGKVNLPIST